MNKEKDTTTKKTPITKKETKPKSEKKDRFAVAEIKGSQIKIYEGKKYEVDFVEGEKGEEIVFDKVLLFSEDGKMKLGKPYLSKAKVTTVIDSQKKDEKVEGLKYKSKSRYRRRYGHRSLVTRLLIKEISV
jgi:large subunit ribosomal protein L21